MDITYLLLPLSITLFIETVVYMFLDIKSFKVVLTAIIMNMILNPLMNLILLRITSSNNFYYLFLTIFEVSTVIIETLVLYYFIRKSIWKTALFSLGANALSLGVGLILNIFLNNVKAAIIGAAVFFGLFIILFIVRVAIFAKASVDNPINTN